MSDPSRDPLVGEGRSLADDSAWPSDALVFFGATGDLAFKKIFPALQAMVLRRSLDIPIIGVAHSNWNLEKLHARARESIQTFSPTVSPDDFADRKSVV